MFDSSFIFLSNGIGHVAEFYHRALGRAADDVQVCKKKQKRSTNSKSNLVERMNGRRIRDPRTSHVEVLTDQVTDPPNPTHFV